MTAVQRTQDPEFDLADRLRKALREADIGVAEMAAYLEVDRNTAGRWMSGRYRPSPSEVKLWAMRCGVRYEWLRDGKAAPIETGAAEALLPHLDSNQKPFGYRSAA